MKKEVIALRDSISEYNKLYNEFENKKTLFNLRVDDLCEEYGCGLHPIGLTEEEINKFDSYAKAKRFFGDNRDLVSGLNAIRKNNSGVDKRKLNSLYIKHLMRVYGYDYIIAYFYVSNYSIYTEAGYYKTLGSETKASNVLRRISNQAEELKKQGITTFDGYVKDAKEKLKPYTDDLMGRVRPIVHQGSKSLAKVFTKIADKTQKKND